MQNPALPLRIRDRFGIGILMFFCLAACVRRTDLETTGRGDWAQIKKAPGFGKMQERELLKIAAIGVPVERCEALAALFKRFAPGRRLGQVATWAPLLRHFKSVEFHARKLPFGEYMGPAYFKGDHGFEAWIDIQVTKRMSLSIGLLLTKDVHSSFEAVMLGRAPADPDCRVRESCTMWFGTDDPYIYGNDFGPQRMDR